jgi:membrane protease YdiL (CAAX protease family)
MPVNKKKIWIFLGVTFALSWSLAFGFYIFGGKWNTIGAVILALVYMFMPLTSVFITQKLIYKEAFAGVFRLNFTLNRWFFIGWLLPPVLGFLTLGVTLLLPGIVFSPDMRGMFDMYKDIIPAQDFQQLQTQIASLPVHPIWLALPAGMAAGITVNAVAAYGEELGWRGFLFDELKGMGFWRSSVLIGFIWGIWHAPLILQGHNYPHFPVFGVVMMTIFCMLLSPLFCFIRLKSNSVVAAAIMHGTLNGTFTLAVFVVKGGNELLIGLTGLTGFVILALANFGILLFRKYRPQVS